MTISIVSAMPKPPGAQSAAQQGASAASSGSGGFGALVDLVASTGSKAGPMVRLEAMAALFTAPAGTGTTGAASTENAGADALAAALKALLDGFSELDDPANPDAPLSPDTAAPLAGLIAELENLLGTGESTAPDTDLLAALQELGAALDLDLDPEAGPAQILEAISRQITGMAEALREGAPELATRLAGLSRGLDALSAALQAAAADAAPDADTRKLVFASQTRANPIEAIEAAAPGQRTDAAQAPPQASPDRPARDLPALEPVAQRPQSGPQSAPQPPAAPTGPANGTAAAAAAAVASTAPAAGEMPDGLTLTPGLQPQPTPPAGLDPARPVPAAYMRPEPQINLPHVAVEISRHAQNGLTRFEIRLNPSELGRIDVRLEMDQSGNVVARLAVERSETLDLLQRDQRMLEKALADAGLDGSKTDLEFSLGGDGNPAQRDKNAPDPGAPSPVIAGAQTETGQIPALAYRGYARLDAVNLWV
ncbi:flagellar hook-length control protein FliK [Pelagibacterium montanilacus]|uniref:flagellar hook-length control protein FliK n=1 Tax=Pelagibacterium montanilacus TaxID=2185280 RepID=UPI000F8D4A69|nr:flagellar hook-length control protein FliK [Pelagibacterium montanilacus]